MGGAWGVYPSGGKWHRGAHRAWLVIKTADHDVVQFDGPVLELMTDGRTRFDQRLAALGPDVLAPEFDEPGFLRRLRDEAQTRQVGDALLDQRIVVRHRHRVEVRGLLPGRIEPVAAARETSDDEALSVIRAVRPLMTQSVAGSGASSPRGRRHVGLRAQRPPARRCDTPIRFRGQGDDNRTTYWCPGCQR